MPRAVCSYCEERPREKLASLYFAWFAPEGDRQSYLVKACSGCLVDRWKTILQTYSSTSTANDTCIGCGGLLARDDSPVYLNLYLPKQTVREFELDFDAACAAKTCVDISVFGSRLPDRNRGRQGERPEASQPSPWDELEL